MTDDKIAEKVADGILIDADYQYSDRRRRLASSYPAIALPGNVKQFREDLHSLREHYKQSKGTLERPQLAAIKAELDKREERWKLIKAGVDRSQFGPVERSWLWKARKALISEVSKHLQSYDAMWQPEHSRFRDVVPKELAFKENMSCPVPECCIAFAKKFQVPMTDDNKTQRDVLIRLGQIVSACLDEPWDTERMRPFQPSPQLKTHELLKRKPVTVFTKKRKKKEVADGTQKEA